MKLVVAALARQGPTVFCFEDIHWADGPTLDLLRTILTEIRHPALFLCVYRLPFSLFPDPQKSLPELTVEEIRLQDLSPADANRMLLSLFKIDTIPDELSTTILKKAEGNPFYLEEVINSLTETGVLIHENNQLTLTRPIAESDVPSTVQGVIAARLDRLGREMKLVLQEASVIGREFGCDILKRISRIREDIDGYLQGLERVDIIRAMSLNPELEYMFKHALTQEVIYTGLLKKERQEIHERIGMVMEQMFADRLSEFYETLAFHFKQGHSVLKAVHYLMKSGEKSLNRFAVEQAHSYFQEAFQLLPDKHDQRKEEREILIDLLITWGNVIYYRGGFIEYEELLTTHEQLAVSLEDNARLGMFYAWFGWAKFWRAKHEEAKSLLEKALRIGEGLQNHKIIGYANCWLAFVYPELGQIDAGIAMAKKALDTSYLLPSDYYIATKPFTALGHAYSYKGNARKVQSSGLQFIDLGKRHENMRSTVMGYIVCSFGHIVNGDFLFAMEKCRTALEMTTDPLYRNYALMSLGWAYSSARQFDSARKVSQEVVDYSRWAGTEIIGRYCEVFLALAAIVEGHMAKGIQTLLNLSHTFYTDGMKWGYIVAEQAIGIVYLQIAMGEGGLSLSTLLKNLVFLIQTVPFAYRKAEVHLINALHVAESLGFKGIQGQVCLDLGRLYKARKRKDKAREYLLTAMECFELGQSETYMRQTRDELISLG